MSDVVSKIFNKRIFNSILCWWYRWTLILTLPKWLWRCDDDIDDDIDDDDAENGDDYDENDVIDD